MSQPSAPKFEIITENPNVDMETQFYVWCGECRRGRAHVDHVFWTTFSWENPIPRVTEPGSRSDYLKDVEKLKQDKIVQLEKRMLEPADPNFVGKPTTGPQSFSGSMTFLDNPIPITCPGQRAAILKQIKPDLVGQTFAPDGMALIHYPMPTLVCNIPKEEEPIDWEKVKEYKKRWMNDPLRQTIPDAFRVEHHEVVVKKDEPPEWDKLTEYGKMRRINFLNQTNNPFCDTCSLRTIHLHPKLADGSVMMPCGNSEENIRYSADSETPEPSDEDSCSLTEPIPESFYYGK